jgi:MFS family permease
LTQAPQTARAEWRLNGMLVLAAMTGVSLTTLHSGSTGVMMGPLEQEFGWSRTEIYFGNSLVSYVPVLLGTVMGIGIDKFGPRRIAIAATVLVCIAYALLSQIGGELWQWWSIWMLVGLALATMPTVWLTAVTARFNVSRGLAVAVALSGTGLSNFLVPTITHLLVEAYGWRGGYIGLAVIWGAVVLPLALLFFRGPREPKEVEGAPPRPAEVLAGLTARQGFHSPSFYKLMFGAFFSTAGGVALIMNMVPVLVSTGIDRGAAAAIMGLAGLATIAGRILGGWLMDRMPAQYIASASTLLAITLPAALLLLPGWVPAAMTGAFVYGFAGGAKIGAVVYLASRHLGQRAFGTLYATINALMALGVGTAPLLANYIYDRTQSYEPVMWAAVPVLAMAAMIYLTLGKYPDFSNNEPRPA